jgi:hypothetical protein
MKGPRQSPPKSDVAVVTRSGANRRVAAAAPAPLPFPTGPVDSEFQSFEVLETAPPLVSGPRSGLGRQQKQSGSSTGVIFAVVGAALFVIVAVAVLLILRSM